MYNSWNSFSHQAPMGHSHRNFSTFTKPENMKNPSQQHNWEDITHAFLNVPHTVYNITKKFSNPNLNQPKMDVQTTETLYEKCSKFINKSNGYPNNPPKTHFEQPTTVKSAPVDIFVREIKNCSPNKKYYKKHKSRKSWHKQNFTMDNMIDDVDEIGTDVCNDPNYLKPCDTSVPAIEHSSWKPTLGEFIQKSSPRKISQEIILTLPNSPICIKISRPVYFSISPPKPACIGHRRMPSDCVSEDSFIVFGDEDSDSSCSEEETDTEESESDCNGDESDFIDFNENSCKNTPKTDVVDIPAKAKKVRFAEGEQLAVVHPMVAWSYAYQASRKGKWEEYARDRCRFKTRVDSCSAEIDKILNPEHRGKVFKERFVQFSSD